MNVFLSNNINAAKKDDIFVDEYLLRCNFLNGFIKVQYIVISWSNHTDLKRFNSCDVVTWSSRIRASPCSKHVTGIWRSLWLAWIPRNGQFFLIVYKTYLECHFRILGPRCLCFLDTTMSVSRKNYVISPKMKYLVHNNHRLIRTKFICRVTLKVNRGHSKSVKVLWRSHQWHHK